MNEFKIVDQMERLHRVIHQIKIEEECLNKIDKRIKKLEQEREEIISEILDMEG